MENLSLKPLEIKKIKRIIESKNINELIQSLERLEIHAESIGEGGNGEVFAVADGPFAKVCLKKVKKTPLLLCNSIDRENELQGKARRAGVRTPLAIISLDTEKGKILIMERIDGSTVEQILTTPSKMPAGFSIEPFIKDLENQVKNMHEAGIYHRDLQSRNIMVNEEGLPVIIDFGTATEGSGSDLTYEESVSMYNSLKDKYEQVSGIFNDDLKMVKNLRSALMPLKLSGVDKS